jgi:hypothetical protein
MRHPALRRNPLNQKTMLWIAGIAAAVGVGVTIAVVASKKPAEAATKDTPNKSGVVIYSWTPAQAIDAAGKYRMSVKATPNPSPEEIVATTTILNAMQPLVSDWTRYDDAATPGDWPVDDKPSTTGANARSRGSFTSPGAMPESAIIAQAGSVLGMKLWKFTG